MSDQSADFDDTKTRVLAEYYVKVNGRSALTFQESMELREYVKSRTDLHSDNLTMEQVIWKSLYDGLTEELRKSSPDSMAEIETLEKRRDNLQDLQGMMAEKMKARPHDLGIRAWWGFVIIGLLVGWMRSSDVWSILVFGLAFWIAGMFFCIFVIDSAEVQSKIAIFLYHKLHMKGVANWLYNRALSIR
jgi:hypothetical protein